MVSRGDFVDEFALGFRQRPPVALLILFLELLKDLSFFYSFDQGLAFLTRLAFRSRNALLLSVDVTLQPLQIILEQQHVRAAKTLALFAALFLKTLTAGVLLFFQDGLFIGQRAPCLGELLLETVLGVAPGDQQCFEAELKHGGIGNRKRWSDRLLLKTGLCNVAGVFPSRGR